ncbi:hypothetical protein EH228_16505 [Erwinia endophytica]|nr:hypothetical protein EH228_16505 [Erwinia endophytica]
MNKSGRFSTGTVVRRKKRQTWMVVLAAGDDKVTCGWSANGRFYKRCFHADELTVIASFTDLWPLT